MSKSESVYSDPGDSPEAMRCGEKSNFIRATSSEPKGGPSRQKNRAELNYRKTCD